jgi:hypothetical protein
MILSVFRRMSLLCQDHHKHFFTSKEKYNIPADPSKGCAHPPQEVAHDLRATSSRETDRPLGGLRGYREMYSINSYVLGPIPISLARSELEMYS